MPDYRFCVSLSITHPSLDPSSISERLGISSKHERMVGEVKKSNTGKPLKGHNAESFWSGELHEEHRLISSEILLEEFLAEQNQRLSTNKDYLHDIVNSGGYIEYFIGWFSEGTINMSATLSSELLLETAALKIAIGLDVYPWE